MCAGIRNGAINEMLDSHSINPGCEQVKVERHLGATASEIRYYSKYNIQLLNPKSLVVVAGANDVSEEDPNNPNPDASDIAYRIAQIARDAKDLGVDEVYIMGIVTRRDNRYNPLIAQINIGLRYLCTTEGFHYIDNAFVKSNDLQRDGLHVNFDGKR